MGFEALLRVPGGCSDEKIREAELRSPVAPGFSGEASESGYNCKLTEPEYDDRISSSKQPLSPAVAGNGRRRAGFGRSGGRIACGRRSRARVAFRAARQAGHSTVHERRAV